MFILKKGHAPGVYVPLRALFLVLFLTCMIARQQQNMEKSNNSECKSILIKEKRNDHN